MFDRSKFKLVAGFAVAAAFGLAMPAGAAVTLVEGHLAQEGTGTAPLVHVASRIFVPSGHGGFHGGFGRGFSPGAGFGSRGFGSPGAGAGAGFAFHSPGFAFHGHGAGYPVAGFHRGERFHGRRWRTGPSIFLDPGYDLYDWDYDSDGLYDDPQPERVCQWIHKRVHDKHGKVVRGWDRWVQTCS